MNVLGDEVREVESFVIVYKYRDRFTSPFARTLRVITKMFGNFWTNVVILVNFWSFNPLHVQVSLNNGCEDLFQNDFTSSGQRR